MPVWAFGLTNSKEGIQLMTAILLVGILLAALWAATSVEQGKWLHPQEALYVAAFSVGDFVMFLKIAALTIWFASPALWIWVPMSQTLLACVWTLGLILIPFWKFRYQRRALPRPTRFVVEFLTALMIVQVVGMVGVLLSYNLLLTSASALMTALGLLAQMIVTVILVAPLMPKPQPLTH